jgi:rhodanese-related sulfurtransferase
VGYWAGFVLPDDARVVLLAPEEKQAHDAARQLLRIGVSRIDGFLSGAMHAWDAAGLPVGSIGLTDAEGLQAEISRELAPLVVDVRTTREWREGHIEGAMHIPLGELWARAAEVPRTRPVATICEAGYRSALAASVLARAGVDDVTTVSGGMAAWRQLAAEAAR